MFRGIIAGLALLAAGCAEPLTGPGTTALVPHDGELVNAQSGDDNCDFDRGVNTCTSTTESTETTTWQVFSGCMAGPPPFGPGRRVVTMEGTWLVRTTTVTQQHGRNGRTFSEESSTERTLVSSRQVSSVCERL